MDLIEMAVEALKPPPEDYRPYGGGLSTWNTPSRKNQLNREPIFRLRVWIICLLNQIGILQTAHRVLVSTMDRATLVDRCLLLEKVPR